MLNHDSSGSGLMFACVEQIKNRPLLHKSLQTLTLAIPHAEGGIHLIVQNKFLSVNFSHCFLFSREIANEYWQSEGLRWFETV